MEALLIGYEGIEEVDVKDSDDLVKLVGGMIDVVCLPLFGEGRNIDLYVNDEGIYSCQPNRAIIATKAMEDDGYLSQLDFRTVVHEGGYYTLLWGPIVAIGFDPETGESVGLTEDKKKAVVDYFSTRRTGPGSGADLAFLMSLSTAI